jgi:hypothetical protein
MFTDEPVPYLFSLKGFLLDQQAINHDPALAALIAEINRELSRRAELPDHSSSDSE